MDVAQALPIHALDCVEARRIDAYWRAANYLSAGQIFLSDNPLLRQALQPAHVKPLPVCPWATTAGQTFIHTHLNRVIRRHGLDMIYVSQQGGPARIAHAYLDGSLSERHPTMSQNVAGMQRLFATFSVSGGLDTAPPVDAALDTPEPIMAWVLGQAETGLLATAWQANQCRSTATDRAVLPILHLSSPEASSRDASGSPIRLGPGWFPLVVEGHAPRDMHQQMAAALDQAIGKIHANQAHHRFGKAGACPSWPVIVLRCPRDWTGPSVPITTDVGHSDNVPRLEQWLKTYRPWELFDATGRLVPELAALAPTGLRRLGGKGHDSALRA